MRFLGTSAANVIPDPFCACRVCEDARRHPEHSRLRSMLQLDEKTLIDFGPDLAAASIRYRLDLSGLERVFVTHTHQDHFCFSNAGLVHMTSTRRKGFPLEIYLSQGGYQSIQAMYHPLEGVDLGLDEVGALRREEVRLHPIESGKPFDCGGYRVMAVDTTHRVSDFENAVSYLFETREGKKLLYACDTGLYPEKTLKQLKGAKIDILILDATYSSNHQGVNLRTHLDGEGFLQMLELLLEREVIRRDTAVFANHINDNGFTHEEYQQWFDKTAKIPVKVAYDGLEIDFAPS